MIAEEKKIWKIREQLEDLTEENYKQFNEKLLPGVKHIIGVRLPALRKIAKETAKSNYSEYLNEGRDNAWRGFISRRVYGMGACYRLYKSG